MPPVETVRPDGPKIRALARANGYSVSGLGRAIGRHPQTLSDIVRGRQELVSIPLLFQIARALHVEPGEISDYSEDTEPEPEPKALASLDAKNGPAADNDRANERDTSRSTE